MAEKLTHLQARRLRELDRIDRGLARGPAHQWLTSHWNSSKASNQRLCDLGFAERFGQTWNQPSGTVNNVGNVRITAAGRAWIAAEALTRTGATS